MVKIGILNFLGFYSGEGPLFSRNWTPPLQNWSTVSQSRSLVIWLELTYILIATCLPYLSACVLKQPNLLLPLPIIIVSPMCTYRETCRGQRMCMCAVVRWRRWARNSMDRGKLMKGRIIPSKSELVHMSMVNHDMNYIIGTMQKWLILLTNLICLNARHWAANRNNQLRDFLLLRPNSPLRKAPSSPGVRLIVRSRRFRLVK